MNIPTSPFSEHALASHTTKFVTACIDCTERYSSIAIYQDHELLGHRICVTPRDHLAFLPITYAQLLHEHQIAYINSFIVCNGPGSFTGIRSSKAFALGAALGYKYKHNIICQINYVDVFSVIRYKMQALPERTILLDSGNKKFYQLLAHAPSTHYKMIDELEIKLALDNFTRNGATLHNVTCNIIHTDASYWLDRHTSYPIPNNKSDDPQLDYSATFSMMEHVMWDARDLIHCSYHHEDVFSKNSLSQR